ncbi:MAG: FlgD immunoglobulin-like domain containing protein [bacterium]
MIEFQDIFDNPHLLEHNIADHIKLIRALANFQVEQETRLELEDLKNQREQLLLHIKELEEGFALLLKSRQEFSVDPNPGVLCTQSTTPRQELIDAFVRTIVPKEMQNAWQPKDFTGSLLVLFEKGEVDSCSLIEKRYSGNSEKKQTSKNGEIRNGKDVTVVDSPASFTIFKSPEDSSVHTCFTLDEPAKVFMIVYDEKEQVVRNIEKQFTQRGDYTIVWDGNNDKDVHMPKGKYYFQLQIGSKLSELKDIEL